MLKAVGIAALVGAALLGVGVFTGVVDFKADAALTDKGKAQVQSTRNSAADWVRGQAGDAPAHSDH